MTSHFSYYYSYQLDLLYGINRLGSSEHSNRVPIKALKSLFIFLSQNKNLHTVAVSDEFQTKLL